MDNNKGIRLWLLGTGTPEPSLRRASSGYIVQINNEYIVFDHGFGAYHRLLQLGIPLTKITHVFLSHYHYDHIGDFPRLLLTRWDQGAGNIPDLKVFGPPPLNKIIDKAFSDSGFFGLDLIARTKAQSSLDVYTLRGGEGERKLPNPLLKELKDGDVVKEKKWTIQVKEVAHQQPYLIPLGFRLEYNGNTFVYSGDSGPEGGLEQFSKSCDVLVHMCHTLSGSADNKDVMGHIELAEMAKNAQVKSLVLTHMNENIFDKPGIREKVIREMGDIFKGNIFFGEDLMEIPFP